MYIQKVSIQNIRSIDHFEMEFPEPAGWHVIIGDNGSGKSAIVRAVGLALLGPENAFSLKEKVDTWLKIKKEFGIIELGLARDQRLDFTKNEQINFENFTSKILFLRTQSAELTTSFSGDNFKEVQNFPNGIFSMYHLGDGKNQLTWGDRGWFSVGFGPFRRFSGGNIDQQSLFRSYPKVGAHLSLFGEDIALTEALDWIKELDYERLKEQEKPENGKESTITYSNIIKFINESRLLPHNTQIEGLNKDSSIIFSDGNGNQVNILELSDGFRSILSLVFELIRNLIRVYSARDVFSYIEKGEMIIDLPGVVLIDEVDAHLHPSWQTRIGKWFTQYFPKLQFIVTTHSPLVCRASEKGSIWRLAAPGSGEKSGEITGLAKNRLLYGNILDAYGTEVFGENISINEDAALRRNRLGELYEKSMLGLITPKEEMEFEQLKAMMPTYQVNGAAAK